MKDFVSTLTKGTRWVIGIVLFIIASNTSTLVYPISIIATIIAATALVIFLLACKAVPSAPCAKQRAAAEEAAARKSELTEYQKRQLEIEEAKLRNLTAETELLRLQIEQKKGAEHNEDDMCTEVEQKDTDLKSSLSEFERTHGRIITKLVGVTFKNEDGTSRQAILKEMSLSRNNNDLSMEVYDFNGEDAIRVLYKGQCCGNIPKDIVPEVLAIEDKMDHCIINVDSFDADDFYSKDASRYVSKSKIYRADLTIIYNK